MPRSSRRHRLRPSHRLPFYFKHEGKNYFAAFFSMLSVVTLCVALAEPDWFYLHGGRCRKQSKHSDFVETLGVYEFFYAGHFDIVGNVYHYSPNSEMYDCVTSKIVLVIRLIIALVFLAIGFSLFAFILDLLGSKNRVLKGIRQNGLWNILTVLICVTINGFCFWASQLIQTLQLDNKISTTSKVVCRFDVSFYIVAAAGGLSVIATACNLLKRHPTHERDEQTDDLLDDYDGLYISEPHPMRMDDGLPAEGAESDGCHLPPPAYTP